jgi:outer membrane protein
MRKLLLLPLLLVTFSVIAQQGPAPEKWDLRKCVEYAIENNIQAKQTDIQAKLARLVYEQGKLSRWPTASLNTNTGLQFGRNIDPGTNQFVNQEITFANFGFQSQASLFNWFSLKNTIEGNRLEAEATAASVQRLKNDISLNVAAAYLQALLSREQVNISLVQLNNTRDQLLNTRKLVDAGSLPELNAAELEAQLARDSAAFVNAKATYKTNILQLKLWMNFDPASVFDLEVPPVDKIPVESFAELDPALVYELALKNMPLQKVNQLRLQSLRKFQQAAKGAMYPTLSAFGNLNTTYSSAFRRQSGADVPVIVPIGFTGSGSPSNPNVFAEISVPPGFNKPTLPQQMEINFRQSVGISLNIPLFNGSQARTAWQRSKLNVQNQELQLERDNQQLKQDIYRAHNDATAAFQRYQTSIKSVATAEYSYELSRKRYEAGLLRTIDLIINQNNLFRERIQKAANQYDYVFRMKVLEFYKGQGLRL